jgi:hypothetical protein
MRGPTLHRNRRELKRWAAAYEKFRTDNLGMTPAITKAGNQSAPSKISASICFKAKPSDQPGRPKARAAAFARPNAPRRRDS